MRAEPTVHAPVPFEDAPRSREFHPGGGGLYGTAPDYIRFIRMLLGGGGLDGNRVLKPETVRLMGENHIGELNVGPMQSAMLEFSNHLDLFPDQDKKWGLSFLINTRRRRKDAAPESRLGRACQHLFLARFEPARWAA